MPNLFDLPVVDRVEAALSAIESMRYSLHPAASAALYDVLNAEEFKNSYDLFAVKAAALSLCDSPAGRAELIAVFDAAYAWY